MAMAYRQKFKKDFFIDIVGYRRYGHNEQDQPAYFFLKTDLLSRWCIKVLEKDKHVIIYMQIRLNKKELLMKIRLRKYGEENFQKLIMHMLKVWKKHLRLVNGGCQLIIVSLIIRVLEKLKILVLVYKYYINLVKKLLLSQRLLL